MLEPGQTSSTVPSFATSLAQEYEIARHAFGLSDAEINALTRTALEAAFVDEETRSSLLARFDASTGAAA